MTETDLLGYSFSAFQGGLTAIQSTEKSTR